MVWFVSLVLFSILTLSFGQLVLDLKLPSEENYMELYDTSLVYYQNQDFLNAQYSIEFALADKRYRDIMLVKCHHRCSDSKETASNHLFFYSFVSIEKCTKKCMKGLFGKPLQLPLQIIKDFKTRQPYTFLQYAYYKNGNLQDAFDSAKIFLKYNKDSEMMQNNVKFYGQKIKNMENVLLHEQPDSTDMFILGTESYGKADYISASEQLRASLHLYIEEVKHCKTLCQTGYDEYADRKAPNLTDTNTFQEQFVKLYHKVIECRYSCVHKYDNLLELEEDYLPRLLNFLQFSAFQTKDIFFAAQIAAAYLEISPGDQVMTKNLKYFTGVLGSKVDDLTTIRDVIHETSIDMEVLAAIVGKKEMRKRLQDKQNHNLGDMGLVSELNPDDSVLWRNTY